MAIIKVNNSSSTQAKTILLHYRINFQSVNADPLLLKHSNNVMQETVTQDDF